MDARLNDIALRPIDFDNYPEGMEEVLRECFDNMPEESREAALIAFIRTITLY